MKYIKTYEGLKQDEYTKNLYWTLPTDDRYIKSLKDIGCTNEALYDLNDKHSEYYYYMKDKDNKFILLSYYYDTKDWSWMPFGKEKYYYDYKYMGYVNVPESELVANKYNL